jgi:hypothetical protein
MAPMSEQLLESERFTRSVFSKRRQRTRTDGLLQSEPRLTFWRGIRSVRLPPETVI